VADARHPRGLIDTSVVIDLERIEAADLPLEIAVSAITIAELAPSMVAPFGCRPGGHRL
jgi:predicted nucleic acid-binding protein